MNLGHIEGNKYKKFVNFSKAVLWKSREISINKMVAEEWLPSVEFVEFEDRNKAEVWIARVKDIQNKWVLKKEGQEPQYYIPIEVFKKLKGTDYLSYKSGIKRLKWDKELYQKKELERGEYILKVKQLGLL